MAFSPSLPELSSVYPLATQEARTVGRRLHLASHEIDDAKQDLLVDFLARVAAFDPNKAELGAFARVCFRHEAARIVRRVLRERAARHVLSLDDALPGSDGLTLGDTLAEDDGYAAWCGQPTDAVASLERRLDLASAAETIDPEDHALCAALSEYTPHEFGEQHTMPRMRIYRRMREVRFRLLAAGITSAA